MLFWSVAALAQQQVRLISDQSELQPCLDNELCAPVLLPLMSETMAEFGAVAQHRHVATSALTGRGTGLHFALQADTLVLGDKNLVTERLQLPPIVPTLEVGYQYGSFTYETPYPQFGVGLFLFPPITIDDTQLGNVGGSVSGAVPLATRFVWAGLDVDASYGFLAAPLAGNGSVLEQIDALGPFITVDQPPCDLTEKGCIDRLRAAAVSARLGVAFEPHPLFFLYGKAGISYVSNTLLVAYDTSRWRLAGIQPAFDYGVGIRLGDRIQLSFGGRTALRGEDLSTDDSRTLTRLGGSFSIRTGDARYWEKDVPVPDPGPESIPEPAPPPEEPLEAAP